MKRELWKPVVGFEGWYEVSSLGHIRRVRPGRHTRVGKILSASTDGCGYLKVSLYKNGFMSTRTVHVLVAAAFLGARPVGCEVNHADGKKHNCAVSNLEYLTTQENIVHAYHHNGRLGSKSKLTKSEVRQVRVLLSGGVSQTRIGLRFGISQAAVSAIKLRTSYAHADLDL